MWSESYRWNFDYARLAYDAGFSFENQKLQTSLDLAKLGLIDLETVIREKDVSTIERFIPFVTQFGGLEGEQVKILDPSFVKVFRISQLAVEYLLFCKKYLDNTVILLKKELSNTAEESKELKTALHDLKSEANYLRKKLKDAESPREVATFRCEQCGKAFATEDYLAAHTKRRHDLSSSSASAYQDETNKLQLEIKELKERLNTTEKLITHHERQTEEKGVDTARTQPDCSKLEELQAKFEVLKTHVEAELKLLHARKEFQEKYEKLFEATIANTKAAFAEAESLKGRSEGGEGDLLERKDSATQTHPEVQEVAVEVACEIEKGDADLQVNLEKIQQELMAETQQQISKAEGFLGEMVATSLGKIESQVHTALEKLSERAGKEKPVEVIRAVSSLPRTPRKSLVPRSKSAVAFQTRELPPTRDFVKETESVEPKETLAVRRSRETIQLYTKRETEIDTESESESAEVEKEKVVIQERESLESKGKPSATSTLGKYSTESIQKAASSEEVFENLRCELEQLVEKRLKEIGVSPDWKGLPDRSFAQALAVVNHQADLFKKKFPAFQKVRKKIVKELTKLITKNAAENKKTKKGAAAKEGRIISTKQKSSVHDFNTTESDEEEEERKIPAPAISRQTYDSVIREFKSNHRPRIDDGSSSEEIGGRGDVTVMKSALRNEMQAVEKKKVAFIDGSQDRNDKMKGGSTTSVASSVLDATKMDFGGGRKLETQKLDEGDLSDWDISEILE